MDRVLPPISLSQTDKQTGLLTCLCRSIVAYSPIQRSLWASPPGIPAAWLCTLTRTRPTAPAALLSGPRSDDLRREIANNRGARVTIGRQAPRTAGLASGPGDRRDPTAKGRRPWRSAMVKAASAMTVGGGADTLITGCQKTPRDHALGLGYPPQHKHSAGARPTPPQPPLPAPPWRPPRPANTLNAGSDLAIDADQPTAADQRQRNHHTRRPAGHKSLARSRA